jgi:hypothetical protein
LDGSKGSTRQTELAGAFFSLTFGHYGPDRIDDWEQFFREMSARANAQARDHPGRGRRNSRG